MCSSDLFVPLTMASLAGVPPQDSGAAASMVNVMQQVGGSLGLAILVTVYGTASRAAASHPLLGASVAAHAQHARVHGMASAFTTAAIFDVVALLVVAAAIRFANPRQPARLAVSRPAASRAEITTPEAAEAEILESEVVG